MNYPEGKSIYTPMLFPECLPTIDRDGVFEVKSFLSGYHGQMAVLERQSNDWDWGVSNWS